MNPSDPKPYRAEDGSWIIPMTDEYLIPYLNALLMKDMRKPPAKKKKKK